MINVSRCEKLTTYIALLASYILVDIADEKLMVNIFVLSI